MLTLAEILRASSVKRWNIVKTVHTQSVAEHSFNVCFIARHLCKLLDMDDTNIVKAALEHDLDEVRFGDIPTPLKAEMIKNGNNLDLAELNNAPSRELSDLEKIVLKVADMCDAILFLQSNWMDRHGEDVLMELKIKLRRYVYDAVRSEVITKEMCEIILGSVVNDMEREIGGRICS